MKAKANLISTMSAKQHLFGEANGSQNVTSEFPPRPPLCEAVLDGVPPTGVQLLR